MRNKYTPEFIEKLRIQAKTKNRPELVEWAKTKGYIMSGDAMNNLLRRNGIKHRDYNVNLARIEEKREIGYERIKTDGSGIVRIKTETGWMYKQRYIYEKHYGEIPKGYMVIFLDGDKTNYDINNLFAVKTGDYLVARNKGLLSNNSDFTRTALIFSEYWHKINEKSQQRRKNDRRKTQRI